MEDFRLRKLAEEIKLRPSQLIKLRFIQREASKDNVLAKQYLEKLRKEEVSIDWADRDDRNFKYQNEDDLVDFIASEMHKDGLDLNNEENLDSYLNTKFHTFQKLKVRREAYFFIFDTIT